MFLFGIIIINTLVAVVLCLGRHSDTCCAYLDVEATRITPPRTPTLPPQHEVADASQHAIPEPLVLEEGPNRFRAIPLSTREHWMRRANQALSGLASPCPFAAFSSVIVNHTDSRSSSPLGRLICAGVNSGRRRGNPTLHGEIEAINRCSEVLQSPPFNLTPEEAMLAFRDLTLYTNGEPCPMCASAIRWAGFRECVYGTSIETLIRLGWTQIGVPSREIFARSGRLSTTTTLIPDVLTAETDPLFSWQFDVNTPCPDSCVRDDTGTCVPV
ncbi:cytidine deaminase-like protein [Nemania sp. FL0031]|nr:cytidine deaminase-like protein [Nemania sp. FL0031]